jgi:pimeloyl-ACP methyl ester carboxylesterase
MTGPVGAGGPLFARVEGEGPPILLLHGLVGSSGYWGPAYGELARNHRLVVPDLLGFGRSPKPDTGYGPDGHVAALVALLDELEITGPAVVGAHSAGSVIALRLAQLHPHRVAAVVAFGPPIYRDPDSARAHLSAMGPMARLFALPGPVAAHACAWVCAHRDFAARVAVLTHPRLPAAVAADSVQHTWASYTGTVTDVVLAADAADWLAHIWAPVTFVAGDRDRVVDRDYLRLLGQAPGRRYLGWLGDHHLPLRRPRDCVDLLVKEASAVR